MKYYIDNTNNEIFAYESDGSQDDIIGPDLVPISDADLATLIAEREQAEHDALTYADKRQAEYPSVADLVVALYDTDDKSAVEAKRAAVKLKYPKPS